MCMCVSGLGDDECAQLRDSSMFLVFSREIQQFVHACADELLTASRAVDVLGVILHPPHQIDRE